MEFGQINEMNTITVIYSSKLRLVRFCSGIIESQFLGKFIDKYREDADNYYLEDVTIEYPDKTRRYFKFHRQVLDLDKEVPMEIDDE